jgi:hypothetical protein
VAEGREESCLRVRGSRVKIQVDIGRMLKEETTETAIVVQTWQGEARSQIQNQNHRWHPMTGWSCSRYRHGKGLVF